MFDTQYFHCYINNLLDALWNVGVEPMTLLRPLGKYMVAPNYKTIFFAEQGNDTDQYMLEPSRCVPFEPLLPCDLAHMHCNVRRGVGAQVMRVVDCTHFALNKSGRLRITI